MKQFFLITVGYSQTGKSTFIEKAQKEMPDTFVRVRSDDIRNFLNDTYPVFQDDNIVKSKVYWSKEGTVKKIQNTLVRSLIQEEAHVALDACNMTLQERKSSIKIVKEANPGIKTIIVRVKIPKEKIYENLKKADEKLKQQGKKPFMLDLYKNVQMERFEEPDPSEADHFFLYNWDNFDEVLEGIKKIMRED